MWCIIQIWSTPKMKLSYRDRSDRVQNMTKTRQDNNTTNCICAVYNENDIELSWLIRPSIVCDINQTRQWHNWLYRCGLHLNTNWTVGTYRIRCSTLQKWDRTMTWPIVQVRSTPKMKLSCRDLLDQVQSLMKTTQDNYLTDRIGLVHFKTETEFSRHI